MAHHQVSEQLLQRIWSGQFFLRRPLHVSDGQPLEILDPGNPNQDEGPDFLNAKIRLGMTVFAGDVELHTAARGWYDHLHHHDPHYNRTILHVVLSPEEDDRPAMTASGRPVPMLVLHPLLPPSVLKELSDETNNGKPTDIPIPCFPGASEVGADLVHGWLARLGWERMEGKIRRFEERLKELVLDRRHRINEPRRSYVGDPNEIPDPAVTFSPSDFIAKEVWEQLLYEGTTEALGYSKNREAFRTLAASVPLASLRRLGLENTPAVMAFLFGAAGLLPRTRSLADSESRMYVRSLRRQWEDLRGCHTGPVLTPGDWKFFRLRPPNFPTFRLAAVCFLLPHLFGGETFRELITLFGDNALPDRQLLRGLRARFLLASDEFWSTHYRFSERGPRHRVGIGVSRKNDIIANVILPVVLLYARIFNDTGIRSRARSIVASFASLQSNSVTRKLERELPGTGSLRLMIEQLGAIRLYESYCTHLRCGECNIGRAAGFRSAGQRSPQSGSA